MTLTQARHLREKWKKNNETTRCEHKQIIDCLTVNNKKIPEYAVCVECGVVHVNPNHGSTDPIKPLEELTAEDL